MRNQNRPEGCIVECYIAEEAIEFCSKYIGNAEVIDVPKPCDSGSKDIDIQNPKLMVRDDLEQAYRIVLENTLAVQFNPIFTEYHLTLYFHIIRLCYK